MDSTVESAVFVWPLHLLVALYADLVSGQENQRGFSIKHTAQGEDGERGDRLTIKFNCKSPLLNGRLVRLQVSGERAVGNFDAERTAALAMFKALRRRYRIFSADYSYGVIAEKRALFTLMTEKLRDCIRTYYDLDEAIGGMHESVVQLSTYVSTWLTSNHQSAPTSTMELVRPISVWLNSYASALDKDRKATSNVVSALAAREESPESLVRLDQTAPMPMVINLCWLSLHVSYTHNWAACFVVARSMMD